MMNQLSDHPNDLIKHPHSYHIGCGNIFKVNFSMGLSPNIFGICPFNPISLFLSFSFPIFFFDKFSFPILDFR